MTYLEEQIQKAYTYQVSRKGISGSYVLRYPLIEAYSDWRAIQASPDLDDPLTIRSYRDLRTLSPSEAFDSEPIWFDPHQTHQAFKATLAIRRRRKKSSLFLH